MMDIMMLAIGLSLAAYPSDIPGMLAALVLFLISYETVMSACTKKIERMSVKEITLDYLNTSSSNRTSSHPSA